MSTNYGIIIKNVHDGGLEPPRLLRLSVLNRKCLPNSNNRAFTINF
jgi:hypothetical protein